MMRPRFEDLACPQCGHRNDFHVDITATAYLDAYGPTVESDYYWDARSCCTCLKCDFQSNVADFASTTTEVMP